MRFSARLPVMGIATIIALGAITMSPAPAAATQPGPDVQPTPATLPADTAFSAGGAGLASAYEQAWLACRLIAQLGGQDGLVRFYRTAAGAVLPVADAVATGLRDATGLTLSAFTARWRSYLDSELR